MKLLYVVIDNSSFFALEVHMEEVILNDEIIECIKQLIVDLKKNEAIENEVIRDEVFEILQRYCTVLYYPLTNECNKAFHVSKIVNEKLEDYVFINTAHHKEKQIFGAAHELGHIWKVDVKVADRLNMQIPENYVEPIVNRFAAELLMPEESFCKQLERRLATLDYNGEAISLPNMLRLITFLMDYFYVPYNAVIIRLQEISKITNKVKKFLEDKYENSKELLEPYINELQYRRLQNTVELKAIDNIVELLKKAEESNKISKNKIEYLKSAFEIGFTEDNDTSEEMIEYGGKSESSN